MKTFGQLHTSIHATRSEAGRAAALRVQSTIAQACNARGEARVIFACAPSQDEFIEALLTLEVDWPRVVVFHMDDYVGLTADQPQSFRHYLKQHLLSRVPAVKAFHPIGAENPDLAAECARYSALLREKPIDLVCLGIGENGHIAFNDPPVADFHDPALIKPVEIDAACRQQQVNDGCFPNLAAVPTLALSLTIPALCGARALSCVVPGPRKAEAVRATLLGPIETSCPASILRQHPDAVLYIDHASASLLD